MSSYFVLMQTIYGKPSAAMVLEPLRFPPTVPMLTNGRPKPAFADLSRPKPVTPIITNERAAHADRSLVEALTQSSLYRQYEHAFTEATGLPLTLRPVESWQLPLHGKRHESPYCALMSEKSRACSYCLSMQERLSQAATDQPRSMICSSGLTETAVPVRLGDRLIAFLQTGQVFHKKPTQGQFERTATMLKERGIDLDRQKIQDAYFATKVVPEKQQESAVTLLKIFAQHLSILSNQIVVRKENAEPPAITRAKTFILDHQSEDLRLGQVAKAVSMSSFYFCKVFRRATGINFTDYLARVRIEKSKNLLLNPNLRISEIGFEVGFQSLTHFNRVFRKLVGQSPTDYRSHLTQNGSGS